MATIFTTKPLAKSSFVGLTLPLGIGFFRDGDFFYAVMQRSHFKMEVFNRTSKSKTFEETIEELPEEFRVATNGNYFHLDATQYYLTAIAEELDLGAIKSDGNVIHNGAILLPDQHRGSRYFFFGRDNGNPPKYIAGGPGNPSPSDFQEAMGGLGPLVMPNPTTGARMPFGTRNVYASDPNKRSDPVTPADFADLVQRFSNTYLMVHNVSVSDDSGLCVLAACDTLDLLFAIVKEHGESGSLDQIRDKLLEIGVENAAFADGSSSATLAIDRETVISPAIHKNATIETGFGFVAQPVTKTLTVTVRSVTFLQNGIMDFSVTANGVEFVNFRDLRVSVGTPIVLNTPRSFSLNPAKNLVVTIKSTGTDRIGIEDDLGEVELELTRERDYQVGRRKHRSDDNQYDLDVEISIA